MQKLLFLMTVAAFCLNCGSNNAGNTSASTKSSNASAPSSADKPAVPPPASNSTSSSNSSTSPAEKSQTSNPELDFTIVNKTGYDIKALSVGAAGTGDWTKDDEILKGRTFADESSMDIKFSPRATAELWDIKVDWADGSGSVEWLKLNLTKIEKVTLTYDKETDKTTANVE